MAAAFVGCREPALPKEMCQEASLHSELAAIDTLMQSRPDSALTLLLDSIMNDPYYQLLLSEALYKNDYQQANRTELLATMAYFDSLSGRDGVHSVSTNDAFLAARCHYMNGVGYYETDSVVPACAEYLKALEIMENHFKEKDFVGHKAKFMALTHTHLCGLFSDLYLHEQAIYFGKLSLAYYQKYKAESWYIAWVLDKIGSHYTMIEQWDSVTYYCDQALNVLADTNNRTYRDITALKTMVSYYKGNKAHESLEQIRLLLSQADDKKEYLARCLSMGEVFYNERELDSAFKYLLLVFNESDILEAKKQAVEWLVEICRSQGKNTLPYTDFLVPFANQEENQSEVKSKSTELYKKYCLQAQERQHQQLVRKNTRWVLLLLMGLLLFTLILTVLYHKKKIMLGFLEHQIKQGQSKDVVLNNMEQFLNDATSREIMLSVQGKNIKRSAIPSDYPELILNDTQLQKLALCFNRCFGSFESRLEAYGITSNPVLVNLCYLYLLGLDEKQVAILLNRDYSTIKRYEKKLKTAFNTQENLTSYIKRLLLES